MMGVFTMNDTINTLIAIFERHRKERVCVVGTTCCGKSTLLNAIGGCVDMDAVAFANLTDEEVSAISVTPWTEEVGAAVDQIVNKYAKIQAGTPMLGTVIVDCEAVVYLDISDELLASHCAQRGVNLTDAKNMKDAVERDVQQHKEAGGKVFYYVAVAE